MSASAASNLSLSDLITNGTLWAIENNRSSPAGMLMSNATAAASSSSAPAIVSCNIYWPENEYMNGQAAFTLYTFTLAFAIPLILILVFYILVIRKLQTVGPAQKSKEKKRSHRKVTRLVLTVVTVYVLCWLPYWVSQVTHQKGQRRERETCQKLFPHYAHQVSLIFTPPKASQSMYMVAVFLLAGCLGYSNSAVNPILYAFLSDNFKKSFMKVHEASRYTSLVPSFLIQSQLVYCTSVLRPAPVRSDGKSTRLLPGRIPSSPEGGNRNAA